MRSIHRYKISAAAETLERSQSGVSRQIKELEVELGVQIFARRFPRVALTLQQTDPVQCRGLIAAGEADVGIITMAQKAADPIVTIPAHQLPRFVIVPLSHPLATEQPRADSQGTGRR